MKPIAWMVGGFALTGLAAALQGMGGVGTGPAAGLPLYVPAIIILLAGQYCLWTGVRTGAATLWSGAFDRRRPSPEADSASSPFRMTDGEPADGFDPDAVVARYIKEREANPDYLSVQPKTPAVTQPPRPTFGRRAV